MAIIQTRVDDNLKARADSLYNSLGLDTTTAIRMFILASLECNGIPFAVRHAADYSLEAAIRDTRSRSNLHGPFRTAREAVASMLEDDGLADGTPSAFVARVADSPRRRQSEGE